MMGSSDANNHIAGIVVVVDEGNHVIGVVTDGDVRRGLSTGVDLAEPVSSIANLDPVTINCKLSPALMRKALMDEAARRQTHYVKYNKIVLVAENNTFHDVIQLADILEAQIDEKVIAVYGLGFVGLTLASTFANAGLTVVGIDTKPSLIDGLRNGVAPFYEKGLDSILSSLAEANPIRYTTDPHQYNADVHVVSVGSPVDSRGIPDLSYINEVSTTISRRLKFGDLVVFRSTVPVGTMRQVVLPLLEKSGLSCGKDFNLAFAPERTVEGNALEELRVLPQIVGGFNRASTSQAGKLFSQITNTIVEVESLEAAELVKLMNNTFRDLVFSFANEVAGICDGFNVNAFSIIRAANEGYPRDRIPMPSPGVGGICLSKDPYLYSVPMVNMDRFPVLGRASRSINSGGSDYVYSKLLSFANKLGRRMEDMNILIVGLAFKGMPETSDIRASIALALIEKLPDRSRVHVKDFVVPDADIEILGCVPVMGELRDAFDNVDAILVMNNHYRNNKFNVIEALRRCHRPMMLFDGWNMFDQKEIESIGSVCYATMGYMTKDY